VEDAIEPVRHGSPQHHELEEQTQSKTNRYWTQAPLLFFRKCFLEERKLM
jgi:hypothetical protein